LIQEFLVESNENLDRVDVELVKLESEPGSAELLASIFRGVRSIREPVGSSALTNCRPSRTLEKIYSANCAMACSRSIPRSAVRCWRPLTGSARCWPPSLLRDRMAKRALMK
jgi:hypothetical protein